VTESGDQGLAYHATVGVAIAPVALTRRFLVRRTRGPGELLTSALLLIAALGASGGTHAAAADATAYAKLLKAHVRPGSVSGIRLHLVDYQEIKADPSYPQALKDLAEARPERLTSDADRLAFWANAYNLLAIKAVLDQYPVASIKDGGSVIRSIWKKKIGRVAGKAYALDDIEHDILRKQFMEPRVHFAIVCASLSCPDLRAEPFEGARLETQLGEATAAFLGNPTKGLQPGADGKTARVSSIFKWFAADFAAAGGAAQFIRRGADSPLAGRLSGLTDRGLSYLPYDWSLNDTARGR
jgi:hypothetical protein